MKLKIDHMTILNLLKLKLNLYLDLCLQVSCSTDHTSNSTHFFVRHPNQQHLHAAWKTMQSVQLHLSHVRLYF